MRKHMLLKVALISAFSVRAEHLFLGFMSRLHPPSTAAPAHTGGCSLGGRGSGCLVRVAGSLLCPHLSCTAFYRAVAKDPGGLSELTNQAALNSWCTGPQSELWCGNLWAGHSSAGRHLQGRWNYPDRSVILMVALNNAAGHGKCRERMGWF